MCDVLVVQTSALDEDRLRDDRLYKKDEPTEDAVDSPAGGGTCSATRKRDTIAYPAKQQGIVAGPVVARHPQLAARQRIGVDHGVGRGTGGKRLGKGGHRGKDRRGNSSNSQPYKKG